MIQTRQNNSTSRAFFGENNQDLTAWDIAPKILMQLNL